MSVHVDGMVLVVSVWAWWAGMQTNSSTHRHWEYTLNKMTVDSVRDVAPGAVKVSASFDEVASIVEAGQVQESYQNKYSIQYDVVKRGNKWMIERGLILDS